MFVCLHCGNKSDRPMPFEPLYTVKEAAAMIPMPIKTMRHYTYTYRDELKAINPPLYRRLKNTAHARLLTAAELRFIREKYVRTNVPGTQKKARLHDILNPEVDDG